MTEKEKLTESLINLLNETYVYDNYEQNYFDNKTGNIIEIVYPGDSEPYLNGWRNSEAYEGPYIKDKNNLTEDELWTVGWVGYIRNIKEGPFKSFDDMKIKCLNDDETKEYKLPEIPKNIQKKFLEKVNKWIKENE